MTNEACASFCDSQGFTMFGTEYSRECFCGYYPDTQFSAVQPDEKCSYTCTGDANEICGAAGYITVYRNYKSEPTVQQDANGYQYLGCYSDDVKDRTLKNVKRSSQSTGPMTVNVCTLLCSNAGYGLAGLEFGDECFCDNKLGSSAKVSTGPALYSGCNMACTEDNTKWCGGKDRLSLYIAKPAAPPDWRNEGCYGDETFSRALGVAMSVPGDYNSMTIEGCTSSCLAAGYQLAGVEYGRECYCASTGDNHGVFYSYEASQCNRVCTGNNLEICGGEDAINIYSYHGNSPAPTTGNLIQNPGFENGMDHWQSDPDPEYGSGQNPTPPFSELAAGSNYGLNAHTGSSFGIINGYNDEGDQQNRKRGVCFSQYVYVQKYGTHYFEFYAGSVNRQSPDPNYKLSYTASVTGYNFEGPLCAGSYDVTCNVPAENGLPEYERFGWYFTLSPGYVTVRICGRYEGVKANDRIEDNILVDDVTLQFITV